MERFNEKNSGFSLNNLGMGMSGVFYNISFGYVEGILKVIG